MCLCVCVCVCVRARLRHTCDKADPDLSPEVSGESGQVGDFVEDDKVAVTYRREEEVAGGEHSDPYGQVERPHDPGT